MLTGPIDPKFFVGIVSQTGQKKTLSISDTSFESVLGDFRMKMLETMINPKPNPNQLNESLDFDLLASKKWVIDLLLRNRITMQSPEAKTQSEPILNSEKMLVEGDPLGKEFSKPLSIQDLTAVSAKRHGIPEALFHKLIETESGFDPLARSSKGAMGLGQLMPATAEELGLNLSPDGGQNSVWNPESNLEAAAKYFGKLFRMYQKRGIEDGEAWKFAAGAYNAGMGNIQKAIEKTGNTDDLNWEKVAARLPEITGNASRETLRYVSRFTV